MNHKFSDRKTCANSVEQDQTDQGLHCWPFCLHLSDSLLYGRATLFNTAIFRVAEILRYLRP